MADSTVQSGNPVVLVGVVPNQLDDVVLEAMRFTEKFHATLVCAMVDTAHPSIDTPSQGAESPRPISPGPAEFDEFDPDLTDHLIHLLSRSEVPRSLRLLTGDPVHELARLADELDAIVIVVGTRHPGLRAGTREFFNGSVAAHLAHRQHRPVLTIPLSPTPRGTKLPWEEE